MVVRSLCICLGKSALKTVKPGLEVSYILHAGLIFLFRRKLISSPIRTVASPLFILLGKSVPKSQKGTYRY